MEDEFVVVLPETESQSAQHVAERVAEQLRSDGEKPPLTVSVGTAVYPRDGRTIEELLRTADSDLYEKKRLSKKRFRLPT
jgi:diguanylate cyclase (GGDEF)-like protein